MKAYDERREELVCALKNCRDVKETADCAALFLDRVGRDVRAEASSREERAEVERLFSAVKCALLCMQAVTRAEITVAHSPKEQQTRAEKIRAMAPHIALLLTAALCVWLILEGKQGAAVLCVPIMQLNLIPQKKSALQEEASASPRADEYELVRQIDRMMERLDAMLSDCRAEREAGRLPADEPLLLTDGLLEPIQMLMEAAETQDGRYALKTLPQVREALRMQGVQAVSFSEENRGYFEMFPSEQGGRTIRPALLREGKLILRGQATESIG